MGKLNMVDLAGSEK
jgi:hypothetical protein